MKILLAIFTLLIGFNISAQSDSKAQERPPIIDMHMHTGLPHEVPEGIPSLCRPAPCSGDGHSTVKSSELMKKTLAAMDRYNIVLGFLSGAKWSDVHEWKKSAPDRFIAAPFILKAGAAELRIPPLDPISVFEDKLFF
jgi:uncharacterized protein